MKKSVLYILLLINSLVSFSQVIPIYIPDPIFKNYLLNDTNINKNGDYMIDNNEAASYYGNLELEGLGIKSLVGLEYFQHVDSVLCANNNVIELSLDFPIWIRYLDCSNNMLTNLSTQYFDSLRVLICDSNELSFLDMKSVSNQFFDSLSSVGNKPLNCILVEDSLFSYNNWNYNIDSFSIMRDSCKECNFEIKVDSLLLATCADSGFISVGVIDSVGSEYLYSWNNGNFMSDSFLYFSEGLAQDIIVTDSSNCRVHKYIFTNGPIYNSNVDFWLNSYMPFPPFPGDTFDVKINVCNAGCISSEGVVNLNYSGPANFYSSSIVPDSISGQSIAFSFDSINFDSSCFKIDLQFIIDTNANINQKVCLDYGIIGNDLDTNNNNRSYCYNIVNSYDPNDKKVYPKGNCNENFTNINDELTYTVRFQNTGNAEARNIYIIDTLSQYLDINTLRIISTSHDELITEIIDGKILKFVYDDINLADSATNESESKGYVSYSIKSFEGFDSPIIYNTAYIYFDFNEPIITNTTMNTMVEQVPEPSISVVNETLHSEYVINNYTYTKSGNYTFYFQDSDGCDSIVELNLTILNDIKRDLIKDFKVIPNPFNHTFSFEIKGGEVSDLLILDLLGKQVQVDKVVNDKTITVNSSELKSGVYLLNLVDDKGNVVGRKKILKH